MTLGGRAAPNVRLIKPNSPWYNFLQFRICTISQLATQPAKGALRRRTMPLKIVSAALTAVAILIGTPQIAAALDPKWPAGPYKYVVIEQDLKDALIEFGRNINVPVKVSDEVKGKLRGD